MSCSPVPKHTSPKTTTVLSLLLALGVGVTLSLALGQTNPAAVPAGALDEGVKLLHAGRYAEAAQDFNRYKQSAPEDARAYFYCGQARSEMGELSEAAAELKEAVRLAPDRPEYRVLEASLLAQLKQWYEAEKTLAPFEKAGTWEALDASWLKLLAEAYYRAGKIKDALKVLALLGRRDPADASVDFDRGKVYLFDGRRDLALDAFKESVEKSVDNPAAYFELGKLLYERNDLGAARQALAEAVKRDKNNPEYVYKLGMTCLAQGEVDEAMEHLKAAEPSASQYPEIYFALGSAYQKKGERARGDEYRKKFEQATSAQREIDERSLTAGRFVAQGEQQLDQGNREQARALFEQAAVTDPNRWDAHAYLAEMLLASPDWQRAYPHLAAMEKIDPDSVVGNYLMAQYWAKSKEYERARVYAEKVRLSRPANSEARSLLGDIYVGLGQNSKALAEYQAAVRLAPDRADFRAKLRQLENQTGQAGVTAEKP